MIAALNRLRRKSDAKASRASAALWVGYGMLGLIIGGFLVSRIIRSPDQEFPLLDWLVLAGEGVASILCFVAALGRHRGRAVPLVLGAAVLAWTLGDITLAVQSLGGASPPTPSLADVFYLAFYPLTYVALVLVMRKALKSLLPGTWLDGVIAGLGAAALCAAFAFHPIHHSVGGNPAAVAAALAYPVGDVLLLALVVGGTALLPTMRKTQWLLLASACGLNAVGDTFNLLQSSGQTSHIGTIVDAIAWPTAILLMSMSVWVRPGHSDPLARTKPPGFLLPGLGALSGFVLLSFGALQRVEGITLGLGAATLVVVGIRLALSVRGLRSLTEERHRQAVTDELTGLANRRQLLHLLNGFFTDQADPRLPEMTRSAIPLAMSS